jgi:peroxiredoxin
VAFVLLLVRLGLAAMFVAAAVGKLSDRDGFRDAIEHFGVSHRSSAAVGWGVPIAELAIAAGLVVVGSAAGAALAAVVLLAVFSIAIVRLMARGESPQCRCFGALGSSSVGAGTLVRNLVLAGLAAFVAVAGWGDAGESVPRLAAGLGAVAVVLGIAICAHAAFSWQLFRQNGRLLDRIEALEGNATEGVAQTASDAMTPGMRAPVFALPDLDGRIVALEDLVADGGTVLFFTDPGCGHCDPLLPVLGARSEGPPVAVISRGTVQANRAKAGRHGLTPILLQQDFEVADAYRAYGMPAAVLVDEAGRIASRTVAGAGGVLELLGIPPAPALGLVHVDGAA